jgi:hypothetical protein
VNNQLLGEGFSELSTPLVADAALPPKDGRRDRRIDS